VLTCTLKLAAGHRDTYGRSGSSDFLPNLRMGEKREQPGPAKDVTD